MLQVGQPAPDPVLHTTNSSTRVCHFAADASDPAPATGVDSASAAPSRGPSLRLSPSATTIASEGKGCHIVRSGPSPGFGGLAVGVCPPTSPHAVDPDPAPVPAEVPAPPLWFRSEIPAVGAYAGRRLVTKEGCAGHAMGVEFSYIQGETECPNLGPRHQQENAEGSHRRG
jgi:hypothetical protein